MGEPPLDKMHKCVNMECPIRGLCEYPRGVLDARVYPWDPIEKCDIYWPIADLRSEDSQLRNQPSNQYQFDARTKRHRRRGGEWK